MASKIKRAGDIKQLLQPSNNLRQRLSSAITTHQSAEIAVLHIMKQFNFHPGQLEQILSEEGLQVSFSKVKYKHIAPFVGLDYWKRFSDAKTFTLHRSRIPTPLLKSIVQDLDVMLVQYGPFHDHQTEETRSRFLSPIFNNLVAQFGFILRNEPEPVIESRITTRGRIEYYFKAFGAVAILCIEIKPEIGDKDGRLNAIAQVIAECEACDWDNTQANFCGIPIYGILCDGITFEFFLFDGSTRPSDFYRGCFPGDPKHLRRGLRLSDFTLMEKTTQFICDLRPICESIFDIMVVGYISSLTAYRDRSFRQGIKQGEPIKSLDKWNLAVQRAEEALSKSRGAELMRQAAYFDDADTIAQNAINTLKLSIELIPEPIFYETPLIMSGWDDEVIQRT
ncbi:hypothetical protein F5887DRAFT_1062352 [Amanita rubescens]|nr:hypothetical protein F5887DRAFT_1062352 [Amanita rubescens]